MRITNPNIIQAILKALTDQKNRVILALTASKPLSAMEIIEKAEIPSSSAYRRISQLEEQGLIGVDRTIVTPDGKSYNLYKAAFVKVTINFQAGHFIVEVVPNQDIVEKAAILFFSIERRKK